MQDIKELILLLEHRRLRPLQQSAQDVNANSTLVRLLEGVSAGYYLTDADAAADLFPGTSADTDGFFDLKSTLREKLIDLIDQFFLELEQYSDPQKVHLECQKFWLNLRSLSGRNASVLALPLAARMLKIAEKFDLTLLCMDIAMYLRIQNCLREPNGEACIGADRKYEHFRQVYDAEFQAEKAYTALITRMVGHHTSGDAVLRLTKESFSALQPHLRAYRSPKLHLYGYLIDLMQHTTALDYAQAMHTCEKAIRFFQQFPYLARDPLQVFYYQHLVFSIHLRRYEAGSQSARACLDLAGEGPFNQMKIKELYLLLALHTKQYDDAFRVFSEVRTDPQFDFLPVGFKTSWLLYEPYLYFLNSAGMMKMPVENRTDPYCFVLQARDTAHGDTRLKSALMAIEFIFLLQQKRRDELLDQWELLEDYCQNSLDNERTRRSYLFFKMLALISAGQFQRYLIIPMASPFLAKLKTTPLALANQTEEIEILPFEDLWDMALDLLNR